MSQFGCLMDPRLPAWARRDVMARLSSVGLGLAMIPVSDRRAAADDQAVYYVLGGYADDALFGPYIEKNGAPPSVSTWADEEEAFVKLRSGYKPDVSYCGTYSVARWRDGDVLQPIDISRCMHWNELYKGLRDIPDGIVGDTYWQVPVGWGTTSVLYRTDLVDIQEESWGLLWDERYAGKLAFIDNVADGVAAAAIYAGLDPYHMTVEDIAKLKEVMAKQRPLLRMYTVDMTSLQQAMAAGEIVAAEAWNDAYAGLKKEGVPVKYMFNPKEGISTWAVCLVLNKDAPNVDKAYDVINSITSPEAGAFWIENKGFGHSNKEAYEKATDEQLEAAGLPRDPDEVLKGGVFQSRMENEDLVTKMFEEMKAGG